MYCKVCGKEVADDTVFCPYCGAKLDNNDNDVLDTEEVSEHNDNGPWKVFAIVGYVLGIIGFVGSFLVWGLSFSVPGIVFSALGKKSTDPEKQAKANKGLKFAIAGTIIGFVATFALVVVLTVLVVTGVIDPEVFSNFDIDIELY